jgi:putative Holliday junction resolvase
MRILAIDPGEKHLGIAISDPTGTIANPFTVITHTSRLVDAATVARLALEQEAGLIVVGQALDDEGEETPQSRKAGRFVQALRSQTSLPIVLWDESGSTQAARETRLAMGVTRRKRRGHLDDLAATVMLQTYLDTHPQLK